MKRYVLHPGRVTSASDGDEHYISFAQLCRLYGLNPARCVDASKESALLGVDESKVVHLYPREDGDYRNPEMAKSVEWACRVFGVPLDYLKDK